MIKSNIPIISFEKANEVLETKPYFHVLKIKTDLDLEYFRTLYRETVDEYEFYKKDDTETYDALSLQYNKKHGAQKNPYADGIEYGGLRKIDSDNPKFEVSMFAGRLDGALDRSDLNDVGKKWQKWFDFLDEKFPQQHIFRTRILRTYSGHSAPNHIDEEACRIHLPTYTNKYNIMWFEEKPYYLPADGSIYICNTGAVAHQFANMSGKSMWLGEPIHRSHLVSVVKPKDRMYTNWTNSVLPG